MTISNVTMDFNETGVDIFKCDTLGKLDIKTSSMHQWYLYHQK